jgi:hypothetical protein
LPGSIEQRRDNQGNDPGRGSGEESVPIPDAIREFIEGSAN